MLHFHGHCLWQRSTHRWAHLSKYPIYSIQIATWQPRDRIVGTQQPQQFLNVRSSNSTSLQSRGYSEDHQVSQGWNCLTPPGKTSVTTVPIRSRLFFKARHHLDPSSIFSWHECKSWQLPSTQKTEWVCRLPNWVKVGEFGPEKKSPNHMS